MHVPPGSVACGLWPSINPQVHLHAGCAGVCWCQDTLRWCAFCPRHVTYPSLPVSCTCVWHCVWQESWFHTQKHAPPHPRGTGLVEGACESRACGTAVRMHAASSAAWCHRKACGFRPACGSCLRVHVGHACRGRRTPPARAPNSHGLACRCRRA